MKYSDEIVAAIAKGLKAGLSVKSICQIVEISQETFYTWKKENSEFSESIKNVELDRITVLLGKIEKAGDDDWRANAWILERSHQEIFAIRQKIDLDAKHEVIIVKPEKPKPVKKKGK